MGVLKGSGVIALFRRQDDATQRLVLVTGITSSRRSQRPAKGAIIPPRVPSRKPAGELAKA
jgi:hypothetical protein